MFCKKGIPEKFAKFVGKFLSEIFKKNFFTEHLQATASADILIEIDIAIILN